MKKDLRRHLRARQVVTVTVAIVTAILAACSDAAAPIQATAGSVAQAIVKADARAAALPNSFVAQGLLRDHALTYPLTVTKVITRAGGSISVPGADFRLEIPSDAFAADSMTFSVTALPGSAVAYNFEPHGSTFLVPLTFVQDVKRTNLRGAGLPADFAPEINGVYFTDPSMIDPTTGIGVVAEKTRADVLATLDGDQLRFPIWHFSGYMASTGRR